MVKKAGVALAVMLLLLLAVGEGVEAAKARYKTRGFDYGVVEATAQRGEYFKMELKMDKYMSSFSVLRDPDNRRQLIVDLPDTRLSGVDESYELNNGYVKSVRFEKGDKNNSRMVITLPLLFDSRFTYKIYAVEEDRKQKKRHRIVVEVQEKDRLAPLAGLAGKLIVIDPGHGGSDSGAIGPSGVKEKTVALAIAERVRTILWDNGAVVVMTREGDNDVYGAGATDRQELQARVDYGARSGADVFISIHANAFTKETANGTATYYYRKTAADARLSQCLQNGMVKYGGRRDRGIVGANFYVVKRSAMPAALVETAFISNREEEALLADTDFQGLLAYGICEGLSNYFKTGK